jgi:hypothetical protein
MMKAIGALASILALMACASTHPGKLGVAKSGDSLPLKISGETVSVGSSYQLVEVTFENLDQDWLRISKTEVVIKNPAASKLSIVTGQDLKDWATAMDLQQKMEMQNRQTAQSGLILAGAVLSGSSNKDVATAGALAGVGGVAWAVSDAIKYSLREAEGTKAVPENHLYHPFAVPGKMFNRRWVVVNIPPGQELANLLLEVETVDGKKGTYDITL